jgi:stage III sporulation protein AB
MKIILISIEILITTLMGFLVSKKYIDRERFFSDFLNFLKDLKINITFSMDDLKIVVNKLLNNVSSNELKKYLKNFVDRLDNDSISLYDIDILKNDEKNNINIFFNSLGKSDLKSENEKIDNAINNFSILYKVVYNDKNKYSKLYTKLGVIIGLFIAIIFI